MCPSVTSYLHAYMSFLDSQKNTGTPKHRGREKKKNIKQEIWTPSHQSAGLPLQIQFYLLKFKKAQSTESCS